MNHGPDDAGPERDQAQLVLETTTRSRDGCPSVVEHPQDRGRADVAVLAQHADPRARFDALVRLQPENQAYFAANPGMWTHGDAIELTEHGGARILGRTDGTLKVHGVVFELHANDILRLDAIEGRGQGYQRLEGIAVEQHPQRSRLHATTYIAEPHHIDAALHPFDWYLDLVLAGAVCASLPQSYCEWLAAHPVRTDSEMNRPTRAEALAILASIPESLSAPGSRRT